MSSLVPGRNVGGTTGIEGDIVLADVGRPVDGTYIFGSGELELFSFVVAISVHASPACR
jgi:hypothetical protein